MKLSGSLRAGAELARAALSSGSPGLPKGIGVHWSREGGRTVATTRLGVGRNQGAAALAAALLLLGAAAEAGPRIGTGGGWYPLEKGNRLTGRADGLQKSGDKVYTMSPPVILPVCRSIRPRTVL